MYILPQQYKCPKCGHECQYSPHDGHEMPVFNAGPVCPRCWGEFVLSVVPIMDCVTFPRKKDCIDIDYPSDPIRNLKVERK